MCFPAITLIMEPMYRLGQICLHPKAKGVPQKEALVEIGRKCSSGNVVFWIIRKNDQCQFHGTGKYYTKHSPGFPVTKQRHKQMDLLKDGCCRGDWEEVPVWGDVPDTPIMARKQAM